MMVRSLFRRARVEAELEEELRYHLERQIEQHVAGGMTPEAARRAALLALGGWERRKEESRDTRRVRVLENLVRDVMYGWRMLRRAPAFAVTSLLTVALGMGATTAIFSLVYGVVLRPLPFPEPDRLVTVWASVPRLGVTRGPVTPADARDWRDQNRSFEDLALMRPSTIFNLTGEGEPERLTGAQFSSNMLAVLGITPQMGRNFTEAEQQLGSEFVVLLSHGLWQRRFGGDRQVLGRHIKLNNVRFTVIGVMPKEFTFPTRDVQVWTPLWIHAQYYQTRTGASFATVARLREGVSVAQAQLDIAAVSRGLAAQYPASNADLIGQVVRLLEDTVQPVRTSLFVLLGAVYALLLIGCANLANLLLARGLARQRELAVRSALGASRARLLAQSCTEMVPVLLLGGILGVLAARWILALLVPLLPVDLPRIENVAVHFPVLLFTALTLALMALLVSAWPALHAARAGLATTIADRSRRTTSSRSHARARDGLVVAQMAVTLLLLVAATLLIRSFISVARTDPGFRTEGVLSAHLLIPRPRYQTNRAIAQVAARMLERVQALPTVTFAAIVNRLPLAGEHLEGDVEIELPGGQIRAVATELRSVSADYFSAMRIPLLVGRSFSSADHADAAGVAIIDEELAQSLWPAGNAIGRRLRVAGSNQSGAAGPNPWFTVVGVVERVMHAGLDRPPPPQVYWHYPQSPVTSIALVVRTSASLSTLTTALPAAIHAIDPDQPLYNVRALQEVVDRSIADRRLHAVLLGGFAVLALLLATIGVYGVIAYAVGQRLREFGIRVALGARRADIMALVMARGGRLLALGALFGLLGALAGVRVLRSLLHNIQPFDLTSFALATLVLALVGSSACILPARRAAQVPPDRALRSE
jgi:putative ABC transport system permease protein